MMYEPIRNYFINDGFQVQGEVRQCDIAAEKDGNIVVIELKKAFTLKLVYQAMERQSRADEVYVAIPRPLSGQNTKQWKSMIKLLKKLEIGLITVAMDSPLHIVERILSASHTSLKKESKKKKQLKEELKGRSGNYNTGGVTGKKIITAYREKAIELGCLLMAKNIVFYTELREMGMEEKQIRMLYSNVYGWYQRISRGCYSVSEMGKKELNKDEFSEIVEFYQNKWSVIKNKSDF